MKRILLATALGISFFAAAPAFATGGYVVGNVDLRAGPADSYPSVGMLNGGASVVVEGCVNGWSWCDVGTSDGRGWIPGNSLQEDYQGQRVLVPAYGERIGIGFVTFDFGTYWDTNYRNRSWYGERARYSQIRPQYRSVVNVNVNLNTHPQPARDENGNHNVEPVRPGTDARPADKTVAEQRSNAAANRTPEKTASRTRRVTQARTTHRPATHAKPTATATPKVSVPKEQSAPAAEHGDSKDKNQR